MENHNFSWENRLTTISMVIFHSYVKLPEGTITHRIWLAVKFSRQLYPMLLEILLDGLLKDMIQLESPCHGMQPHQTQTII